VTAIGCCMITERKKGRHAHPLSNVCIRCETDERFFVQSCKDNMLIITNTKHVPAKARSLTTTSTYLIGLRVEDTNAYLMQFIPEHYF
jgi:hypothetical protein